VENSAKNCTSHIEPQVVTDANLRIWLGLTPTPIGTAPPFYLEVAGRHQMPVLQGISSIEPSTELVTFSARLRQLQLAIQSYIFMKMTEILAEFLARQTAQ